MTEPVTNQFLVFLYTILTGALAGLFYDVYAGMGQVIKLKKFGVLVGDVIFWAVLTPMIYALLIYYNQGEVRFFVLIGLGIGALSYFGIFRCRIRTVIVKLIELVIKAMKLVGKGIYWTIVTILLPFKIIYQVVIFPFRMLGLGARQAGFLIKKFLKFIVPAPVKNFIRKFKSKIALVLKKIRPK